MSLSRKSFLRDFADLFKTNRPSARSSMVQGFHQTMPQEPMPQEQILTPSLIAASEPDIESPVGERGPVSDGSAMEAEPDRSEVEAPEDDSELSRHGASVLNQLTLTTLSA